MAASIKVIDTPYVKKHGYGVATPERVQSTLDFIQRSLKLDTKLTPKDIYVPALEAKANRHGGLCCRVRAAHRGSMA